MLKNYTSDVDCYKSLGEIQSALAKAGASKIMKNAQEELAAEREKTAAAERKAAELRKAQAMSDPVVTEFGVIFGEVQTKLKRLKELTKNAGENAPRLEAALAAMGSVYIQTGASSSVAVSSVQFVAASGNIMAGSIFKVYGVKK